MAPPPPINGAVRRLSSVAALPASCSTPFRVFLPPVLRRLAGLHPQRPLLLVLLLSLLLGVSGRRADAHEIPERVTVLAFVRHTGPNVRVLLRVPLESMRDVAFPLRGDGTLVLGSVELFLREAAELWVVPGLPLRADGAALSAPRIGSLRLSLPSERGFDSFDAAMAHVRRAPVDTSERVAWTQTLLDVLLEYDDVPAGARLSLEPALAHLGVRTTTVVRTQLADGTERAFRFEGDPGLVALDPTWWQAASSFVVLGVEHILGGIDHLLFVCCLVIPVRRWRPLVAIVSAFTVAHSLTLIAAALGVRPDALWFPPLVETLIAASIVYMAAENVLRPAEVLERRWPMAFAFGLVHGFGFSFALGESLQFAGSHLVTSLAAFNVGVELGQIAVLAVVTPVLAWVFTRVARPTALVAVLSLVVGHTAWHWMSERGSELLAYDLALGAPSSATWLVLLRLLLLALVAVAVAWGLSGVFGRLTGLPVLSSSRNNR